MQTSKLCFAGWLEGGFELLLRLTAVAVFFAIAIWLWPRGLLQIELAGITPEHVVRVITSIMFLLIGITSIYFVVVEPFVRAYHVLGRDRSP